MKTLSLFIFACIFSGSIFASDTVKQQIDISKLPQVEGYSNAEIHDWIDLLEKNGDLVNVPQDVINYWRHPNNSIYIQESDVLNAIEIYNNINAKSYEEIEKEFQFRGESLPKEYYEYILELWRDYELRNDYPIANLEEYKQELAYLSSLTDEQWSYIEAANLGDFYAPYGGYYDLDWLKTFLEWYLPLEEVPNPSLDIAHYFVFTEPLNKHRWPILVVVDSDNVINSLHSGSGYSSLPLDAQSYRAKLRWKYVMDNDELILPSIDYGSSIFRGLESDVFYIPPKKGRLYWQFYDYALVRDSNIDAKANSEWVGGIEITACYTDVRAEIYSAVSGSLEPYRPIEKCGNSNWSVEKYLSEQEEEYQESHRLFKTFETIVNPARNYLIKNLYVEDFEGSNSLHSSAPDWAHEKVAAIKAALTGTGEFSNVMSSIAVAVDGYFTSRDKDISEYPYGTIRLLSKYSQGHRDKILVEVIYDDDLRNKTLAYRREQIRLFRAGEIKEIDWRLPKDWTPSTSNTNTQDSTPKSPPVIDQGGISPSGGPEEGGNFITITGSGFQSNAIIQVGGFDCTSRSITTNEIKCIVDASLGLTNPFYADVTIMNGDGQWTTLAKGYRYGSAPTVTSVAPAQGSLSGGTEITITGNGFYQVESVTVGDSPCSSITEISSSQITCITPAGTGLAAITIKNSDGQEGTGGSFQYKLTPPSISSISSPTPAAGPLKGGTLITINGMNFMSGATVNMGGNACIVTTITSTQIICTNAAHVAGSADVIVTNPDGQMTILNNSYTYQVAPTITSIKPDGGNPIGGTSITINGSDFLTEATVSVGASPCSNIEINPTSITCTTPAGAAGVTNITVTNTDKQSAILSSGFTYQNAPTITSVSPSIGKVSGETPITITGSDFLTGATVNVGTNPCSNVVVNPTSITCTTPARMSGAVGVTVSNTDGQSATLASGFTYQNAPTITSVSPSTGKASGGTSITITGSDFLTGATVNVGTNPCSNVVVNPTSITCTTPAGTSGAVGVTVSNTDGQSVTLSSRFIYLNAPTITSVTPSTGKASGGTSITITGSDFLKGVTVNVGANPCSNVVVNPISITCTAPRGAVGVTDITVTNTDKQSATLASGFTYQNAPTIISISPSIGKASGGTPITITGSDFLTGATVNLETKPCSNVVVNPTSITCTTPAGMSGAVGITVSNIDGQSATLASGFTYQNAPTITSISPSTGKASGGTPITITGSDFLTGATVNVGTNLCSNVIVNPTSITCTTPAGAVGVADISVSNTDGQSVTLSSRFIYLNAPTITSVSPSTGKSNGGTSITITGSDFLKGVTVRVGANPCSNVVVNPISITCTAPRGAAGVADITVINTDKQSATLASGFTYQNAPTITSISPETGNPIGGTPVAITGSDFLTGATVDIGVNPCSNVVVNPPYSASCSTPTGYPGTVDVTISNIDGQFATLASGFTYQNAPTVTSISPNTDNPAGGSFITITGSDFLTGAIVNIGTNLCSHVVVNPTSITCTTPAGNLGLTDITVTNTDGQSVTLPSSFTYQDAPTISSVSPNAGNPAGETLITILGSGFITGATVDIGANPCTNIVVTPTRITCTTPVGTLGVVDITVTNTDGQSVTLPSSFTYQNAPIIDSISPNAGNPAGETLITILGSDFLTGATVDIDSSPCSNVVVNPTSITCTTPAGNLGVVDITVTNTDGQSIALASGFTYQNAPTITSVSPTTGKAVGGTSITITGTNFLTGATVNVGTNLCSNVVVNSTSITCTTPSGIAGMADIIVTNTDGQSAILVSGFTYQNAPTITSVSPATDNPAGGTPITITGSDFLTGATVNVGTNLCSNVVVNPTNITCTTPSGIVGVTDITITNADGQTVILPSSFTYQDAPTISSVSPNAGNPIGGTSITITGSGFLTGATVNVGKNLCLSVDINPTSITCTTPAGTIGIADITVTNTDGQTVTLPSSFTYQNTPTISSVSPDAGNPAGNTPIAITGSNFLTGATVNIGANPCTNIVVTSTRITCTTPAGIADMVDITVSNTDGQFATLASGFTYQNAPTSYFGFSCYW